MPLVATEAVVLHAFDYLETSRILRLLTRDAGVQSVIAKGARRHRSRYGSALDLFAAGMAQLYAKPGRELHTLASFEVIRARHELSLDLARFTAASALAELTLRFARDDAHPSLFDMFSETLDRLTGVSGERAREAAIAGAWRLVAELGFAPELERCVVCQLEPPAEAQTSFNHGAGGIVCARCARGSLGSRRLPAAARHRLLGWMRGSEGSMLQSDEARAHQRLLREFLREHLADERPLRAFEVWEHERWGDDDNE